MASNVLPSAPHDETLYLQLPQHDFRMQKANEVSAALNAEVVHYRGVAKKYKRVKKTTNLFAAGSGMISAACSTASFGSALTVVGIPAAIPLGGVGGLFHRADNRQQKARFEDKKNTNRFLHSPSQSETRSGGFIPKPSLII